MRANVTTVFIVVTWLIMAFYPHPEDRNKIYFKFISKIIYTIDLNNLKHL